MYDLRGLKYPSEPYNIGRKNYEIIFESVCIKKIPEKTQIFLSQLNEPRICVNNKYIGHPGMESTNISDKHFNLCRKSLIASHA